MAAENEDATAMYNLSELYRLGLGLGQDSKKAFHWLSHAAEMNMREAECDLGIVYKDGLEGICEKNLNLAFVYLKRAAEKGMTLAQYWLARMLESGAGVDQDASAALKWYRLATENGHVQAMYRLGLSYLKGEDTIAKNFAFGLMNLNNILLKMDYRYFKDVGEELSYVNSFREVINRVPDHYDELKAMNLWFDGFRTMIVTNVSSMLLCLSGDEF